MDSYKDLTASEQTEFWRSCLKTAGPDESFQYGKIRGCIVSTLSVKMIKQEEARIQEEYLPLSVWQARGFPIDVIEQKGKSEVNPVLGKVYSCPVKIVSQTAIRQQVEQVIRRAEQKVKGNGDEFDGSDNEEPVAVPATGVVSEKELEKKRKLEEASSKKAAEQAEKKRKADMVRENSKQIALATKSLSALTGLLPELDQCIKRTDKSLVPALVTDEIAAIHVQVKSYFQSSSSVLDGAKKATQRETALGPLPFDGNQIQDLVKKANLQIKLFKKMATMLTAK